MKMLILTTAYSASKNYWCEYETSGNSHEP